MKTLTKKQRFDLEFKYQYLLMNNVTDPFFDFEAEIDDVIYSYGFNDPIYLEFLKDFDEFIDFEDFCLDYVFGVDKISLENLVSLNKQADYKEFKDRIGGGNIIENGHCFERFLELIENNLLKNINVRKVKGVK